MVEAVSREDRLHGRAAQQPAGFSQNPASHQGDRFPAADAERGEAGRRLQGEADQPAVVIRDLTPDSLHLPRLFQTEEPDKSQVANA